MIEQQTIGADILYVNGDSWVHGSELIDPASDITNHFDQVHHAYRVKHAWPKLVADLLGLELYDGSLPGASNEYVLRTTIRDISQLRREGKRPFAIVSWTQLQRFELPKGPDGGLYEPFVSPTAANQLAIATKIWAEWSSDRSDVVRWSQQLILLDAFLKVNGVNYFGTTVFASSYRLLEQFIKTKAFEPYLYQLATHVQLSKHMLNFSLESILLQYDNIQYGPGGHPLADGHKALAEYIKAQVDLRYKIKTIQARG